MEITVKDKWQITGDSYGITIKTWSDYKEGAKTKGGWLNPRYYPNLETALMHLIDMDISDSATTSFEYLITHINQFKEEVIECLKEIQKKGTQSPVMKPCGNGSKSKLQKRGSASKNSSPKS